MVIDWPNAFDEQYPAAGASQEELEWFVEDVRRPLVLGEAEEITRRQGNPFGREDPLYSHYRPCDPSAWIIPSTPLPLSYLSFLSWSNGGEFRTGARWFQFFSTREVREHLLAYHLPEYMPGVLPFAMDGGSLFYMFDMRRGPVSGEYPVLVAAGGNLGYDDARAIAGTFIDACVGRENPAKLL